MVGGRAGSSAAPYHPRQMHERTVIALGGNAIAPAGGGTAAEQIANVSNAMGPVADLLRDGTEVVLTHGNGPQVGFILRRSELSLHELHPVPLDYCGADTQGAIGYMLQQALDDGQPQSGARDAGARDFAAGIRGGVGQPFRAGL